MFALLMSSVLPFLVRKGIVPFSSVSLFPQPFSVAALDRRAIPTDETWAVFLIAPSLLLFSLALDWGEKEGEGDLFSPRLLMMMSQFHSSLLQPLSFLQTFSPPLPYVGEERLKRTFFASSFQTTACDHVQKSFFPASPPFSSSYCLPTTTLGFLSPKAFD